jgi:hypothetical protein
VYAAQQAGNTTTSKHCWVDCDVCGTSLVAESLQSHLETQHDIFRLFLLNRDIVVACEPDLPCYCLGATVCGKIMHQVKSMLTFPHATSSGSHLHFGRGPPTLAAVQSMRTADTGGGPQRGSLLHRAVPERMGEEVSTYNCRAFSASPQTYVYV